MSKSRRNGGGKFFMTTKKGEIAELKKDLVSGKQDIQKEAVKKVIAAMTVGKDVSSLFTVVLNCMQTDDLELKKLVYLYVMNYAKSNPDLAILAVNTFQRDTRDPNALIRALAVRTMGCIRVDKITEYLCKPLRQALKDEDPYVRKTAAVCVAKLYDISPELVEVQGFIKMLQELISDSNPMVVANSVASLAEIQDCHGTDVLRVTTSVLQKLLAALNECSEWGQVFILDALAGYSPKDEREAESIVERVVPRLKHANSAVVLSAIKVIMRYMPFLGCKESEAHLIKKMAPPLVSLMSHSHGEFPEIQYVALRNINLVVQKLPTMLTKEIKVFFCKYDDPIYVKMEKLEIIIKLTCERNVEQVLMELKEYSREVDVDFVRKSVRAIGRCAIKLERAAERCINVLLDLIQTKVNYVVQEAIIVIKDIFRKYPNRYESIIATLCENLVSLDEPEAKAAMVWIIGEYAERIDNADELLEHFMDTFEDEPVQVQLQLLTAVVKLFLKKPSETQDMVQSILNLATEKSDDPDLRDRGYIYWRLLSTDAKAAKAVVLADKPVIADDTCELSPDLLDELLSHMSTLAAIYHKPPNAFVTIKKNAGLGGDDFSDSSDDSNDSDESSDSSDEEEATQNSHGDDVNGIDLLGLDLEESNNDPVKSKTDGGDSFIDDLFGGSDDLMGNQSQNSVQLNDIALKWNGNTSNEFVMRAAFTRVDEKLSLQLQVTNTSQSNKISKLALQFNKNFFGLKPNSVTIDVGSLNPGETSPTQTIPLSVVSSQKTSAYDPRGQQAAIKNNLSGSVAFFYIPFDMCALFTKEKLAETDNKCKQKFLAEWKAIEQPNEFSFELNSLKSTNVDAVSSNLESFNVHFITNRNVQNLDVAYFSIVMVNEAIALVELRFQGSKCVTTVKSKVSGLAKSLQGSFQSMLCN